MTKIYLDLVHYLKFYELLNVRIVIRHTEYTERNVFTQDMKFIIETELMKLFIVSMKNYLSTIINLIIAM